MSFRIADCANNFASKSTKGREPPTATIALISSRAEGCVVNKSSIMANNQSIDTSSLTAIITEFRRLQAKDSITPEALGSILQRIADLLATAGTSDIQQALNNWYNAMRQAAPYIAGLAQANFDRNNVLLNPTLVDPIEGQSYVGNVPITIQPATTEKAGAMKAQQVTDLNTLRNRYSDTVTPAVEAINTIQLGFGIMDRTEIDNLGAIDNHLGRLIKVQNNSGYTDGYIMHIVCHLYVTQVFFTHCKLTDEGELVSGTHDEKGFHIYKRYKNASGAVNWSRWQLVGGDEFAEVKRSVDTILGNSNELGALSAKGQIAVEIVDGELRVWGSGQLAQAGYVPYLFRHTRKRNRDKIHVDGSTYTYGPVSKGWHLFGSRHSVIVEGTVAKFSTNESRQFHQEADGYTPDPIALVHPHIDGNGKVTLPWGRSVIKLFDFRARQNRMVRLRFAIGYAKPVNHGKGKVNVLNLVSNLAEFSVVYNPRSEEFTLSR